MLSVDDTRVNKGANVKRANFRYPTEQCFSRFVFEHFLKPFFKHHANNSDVVEAHLLPGFLIQACKKERIAMIIDQTKGNVVWHFDMLAVRRVLDTRPSKR